MNNKGNTQPVFPIVAGLIICCFVLAGVVLAFMTRKVSRIFAEREIIPATFNVTLIGGAISLLYFFAGLSVQLQTVVVGFGLAWCSAFTIVILIVPKLWLIRTKSEAYVETKAFGVKNNNVPGAKSDNQEGTMDFQTLKAENEALKQEILRLKAASLISGGGSKSNSSEDNNNNNNNNNKGGEGGGNPVTNMVRRHLTGGRRTSTESKPKSAKGSQEEPDGGSYSHQNNSVQSEIFQTVTPNHFAYTEAGRGEGGQETLGSSDGRGDASTGTTNINNPSAVVNV